MTKTLLTIMDAFVFFMCDITLRQFKRIVPTFSRTQVKYLKEIINNILRAVIQLSETDKVFLKKSRYFLRRFIRRGVSRNELIRHSKVLHTILKIAKKTLT